jgi:GntR family transcriptional regulator
VAANGKRLRYVEIADAIRQRVRNGEVDEEGRVGTFGSLEADYSAAKGTIEKALGLLRDEGVVVTIAGKGIFVADAPGAPTSAQDRLAVLESEVARLHQELGIIHELRRKAEAQDELLAEFLREVKEHARMLARMRQRLEKAGINLSDSERDEQAMLRSLHG